MTTALDPYTVLGINTTCTKEEAYRAYRQKAKETHPDLNKEPIARDRFIVVTKAWEFLCEIKGFSTTEEVAEALNVSALILMSPRARSLYSSLLKMPLTLEEKSNLNNIKWAAKEAAIKAKKYTRYDNTVICTRIFEISERREIRYLENRIPLSKSLIDLNDAVQKLHYQTGYSARTLAFEAWNSIHSLINQRIK